MSVADSIHSPRGPTSPLPYPSLSFHPALNMAEPQQNQPEQMEHDAPPAPPTHLAPESRITFSVNLLLTVIGAAVLQCRRIKNVDPLKEEVEDLRRQLTATNTSLDVAYNQIIELQTDLNRLSNTNTPATAAKVHVPRMDLP